MRHRVDHRPNIMCRDDPFYLQLSGFYINLDFGDLYHERRHWRTAFYFEGFTDAQFTVLLGRFARHLAKANRRLLLTRAAKAPVPQNYVGLSATEKGGRDRS